MIIYKYELTHEQEQSIRITGTKYKILKAKGFTSDGYMHLVSPPLGWIWVLIEDPNSRFCTNIELMVLGTGDEKPCDPTSYTYIDTIFSGSFVFHLFESMKANESAKECEEVSVCVDEAFRPNDILNQIYASQGYRCKHRKNHTGDHESYNGWKWSESKGWRCPSRYSVKEQCSLIENHTGPHANLTDESLRIWT